MLSKHSLLVISASAVALTMAACGSGGGDDAIVSSNGTGSNGGSAVSTNDTGQATGNDAFLAQVRAVIGTTSETAEPGAISSAPATFSESAQPEPLS
jgi:hypothetical protein